MAAFELGIIFSSMSIDVITLLLGLFSGKSNQYLYVPKRYGVSVIIPACNEERSIRKCIECAFDQTLPPREVIVVDDASTDMTPYIVKDMQKRYPNLVYIRQPENRGKARNINRVLLERDLPEIVLVLDADTFLTKTYIEFITRPFSDSKVAVVCSTGSVISSGSRLGRFLDRGREYQFNVFLFRKRAQDMRNAISVISGDSAAYRTDYLREIGGMPVGTQTEDTDVTWTFIEKGYKVRFKTSAKTYYKDTESVTGHFRQVLRWYCGICQCLFVHGRNIFRSKSLSFTTIIPSLMDTFVYTPVFLLLPLLGFYYPYMALGFLLADFVFTLIFASLLYKPKYVAEIYFVKLLWGIAWVAAVFKTSAEYLLGRKHMWRGAWGLQTRGRKGKGDSVLKIGISAFFAAWLCLLAVFIALNIDLVAGPLFGGAGYVLMHWPEILADTLLAAFHAWPAV